MRFLAALILFFPAVLFAAPTTPWDRSFSPASLARQLDKPLNSYLVAAAGTPSPELDSATGALTKAFRTCGKAKLVMSDDALGSLTKLDDVAIVKKAAAMPVQRVAVLRLFQGGVGEAATAVVTLYDKAGQSVGAFSVRAGELLAAPSAPAAARATEGVSSEAALGVLQVEKTKSSASDEYEKKRIWIEDLTLVNQYGQPVASLSNVYQGKYKKPLIGADFYRAVGRADLANKFEASNRSRKRWGTAGFTTMMAGTVLSLASLNYLDEKEGTTMLVGGLGLVLAGPMIARGGPGNPHPVSAEEARQLVDEYNESLKASKGVSSAEPTTAASRYAVSVNAGPSGGSIAIGMRF